MKQRHTTRFAHSFSWRLLLTSLFLLSFCSGRASIEGTVGSTDGEEIRESPGTEPVVVLTSTNFDKFIGDGSIWLVEFYAPWCTYCKQFAPTYAQIGHYFRDNPRRNVKVGKVDATVEKALGQRFAVQGYPSFYVIHGSRVWEYDDKRSKDAMIRFASKGYKEKPPIPFYASPMGPMGRLQGLLIWIGVTLVDIFKWIQEKTGLSPVLAGCMICATAVFGGVFFMVFLVVAISPREKVD